MVACSSEEGDCEEGCVTERPELPGRRVQGLSAAG